MEKKKKIVSVWSLSPRELWQCSSPSAQLSSSQHGTTEPSGFDSVEETQTQQSLLWSSGKRLASLLTSKHSSRLAFVNNEAYLSVPCYECGVAVCVTGCESSSAWLVKHSLRYQPTTLSDPGMWSSHGCGCAHCSRLKNLHCVKLWRLQLYISTFIFSPGQCFQTTISIWLLSPSDDKTYTASFACSTFCVIITNAKNICGRGSISFSPPAPLYLFIIFLH